jgi:NAD(P)H-quinone oxidoreductase subunit 5
MALMLIEAALGFYELALLHLFAHSLYKAHQFLRSGSTVDWVTQAAIAAQQPTSVPARIFASTVVVVAIAVAVYVTGDTAHLPSWLLLGALASVILARVSVSTFVTRIAAAVVILGLFMLQRALVGEILAVQTLPAQTSSVALLFTDAIFALLWLGWTLDLNRLAVPAKMTAGLEELAQGVDDRLTALTFSIWPHNSPSGLLEDGPTPERPIAAKHNIMELK